MDRPLSIATIASTATADSSSTAAPSIFDNSNDRPTSIATTATSLSAHSSCPPQTSRPIRPRPIQRTSTSTSICGCCHEVFPVSRSSTFVCRQCRDAFEDKDGWLPPAYLTLDVCADEIRADAPPEYQLEVSSRGSLRKVAVVSVEEARLSTSSSRYSASVYDEDAEGSANNSPIERIDEESESEEMEIPASAYHQETPAYEDEAPAYEDQTPAYEEAPRLQLQSLPEGAGAGTVRISPIPPPLPPPPAPGSIGTIPLRTATTKAADAPGGLFWTVKWGGKKYIIRWKGWRVLTKSCARKCGLGSLKDPSEKMSEEAAPVAPATNVPTARVILTTATERGA